MSAGIMLHGCILSKKPPSFVGPDWVLKSDVFWMTAEVLLGLIVTFCSLRGLGRRRTLFLFWDKGRRRRRGNGVSGRIHFPSLSPAHFRHSLDLGLRRKRKRAGKRRGEMTKMRDAFSRDSPCGCSLGIKTTPSHHSVCPRTATIVLSPPLPRFTTVSSFIFSLSLSLSLSLCKQYPSLRHFTSLSINSKPSFIYK